MNRRLTLMTAVAVTLMLGGSAYAQSPYGNPASSSVGGVAASQGVSAGVGESRAAGGNPAEYDTSIGAGTGPAQAQAIPYAGRSEGAGQTGITDR